MQQTRDLTARSRSLLWLFGLFAFSTLLVVLLSAQDVVAQDASLTPIIVERGPHSRVWKRTTVEALPDGTTRERESSFVELATGLHYANEQGEWAESQEVIELAPGGAVAHHGSIKAAWSANLNNPIVLDVLAPDGKRFKSRVLGLAFTSTSGESVLISEPKDCLGEIIDNSILYRDAFNGPFRADVRYTYTLAGISQEVLIREAVPSPAEYQLDPARVRLEIWTEFLEAPLPTKATVMLKVETDPLARQGAVDPDLTDDALDFGLLRIGPGKAFPLGNVQTDFTTVEVGKTWIQIPDGNTLRTFLVEKIDYRDVQEQLNALPQAAALGPRGKLQMQAAVKAKTQRQQLLASLRAPAGKEAKEGSMRLAAAMPSEKGFNFDYESLLVDTNAFIFKADTTYFIRANVNLAGATVLESSVIKFTNGNNIAKLVVQGTLDCRTDIYRPAIFTAKDDDTVGELITGSTGNPTTNYYGYFVDISGNTNEIDLHDVHMRRGYYGVNMNSSSKLVLRHAQISGNYTALVGFNAQTRLRNVLMHDMTYAYGSGGTDHHWEHVTFHRLANLRSSGYNTFLTNCLVLAVTNDVVYTGQNVISNLNDSGYFQTVGAGGHYLANNSTNRDAGTTGINPALLVDLKKRTTYPPIVLPNNITTDTTLPAQAQRDTDAPDIGYHLDPLDYVANQIAITNATLTLQAGTALGVYGASGAPGLRLLDGGKVISSGTPDNLNRVVRYNLVQEQATTNWSASSVGPSITTVSPYGTNLLASEARFRFTEFAMPASGNDHLYAGATNLTFTVQDCQFHGGQFTSVQPNVTLLNNLFNRVAFKLYANVNPFTALVRNGTFTGGSVIVSNVAGGGWTFTDNLFDTTNIFQIGIVTNNFNAYLTNPPTRLTNNGAYDVTLAVSNITYDIKWLGRFYLPTNLTSQTNLFNRGSQNATNAGLYHYTTTTNQVKETNSTVDIGFHYVAVNSGGAPVDTDGDGLADYFEDTDGDGSADTGEFSWTTTDTNGDGVSDYLEYVMGRNPAAGTTNDVNGVINFRLYTPLK